MSTGTETWVPTNPFESTVSDSASMIPEDVAEEPDTDPTENAYVLVWRDPDSSRDGLLTYVDRDQIATRPYDEVVRATPPVHVLKDTLEDREYLEAWLRNTLDDPAEILAVPEPLVLEILGWEI